MYLAECLKSVKPAIVRGGTGRGFNHEGIDDVKLNVQYTLEDCGIKSKQAASISIVEFKKGASKLTDNWAARNCGQPNFTPNHQVLRDLVLFHQRHKVRLAVKATIK
jgi:hypothetical protein